MCEEENYTHTSCLYQADETLSRAVDTFLRVHALAATGWQVASYIVCGQPDTGLFIERCGRSVWLGCQRLCRLVVGPCTLYDHMMPARQGASEASMGDTYGKLKRTARRQNRRGVASGTGGRGRGRGTDATGDGRGEAPGEGEAVAEPPLESMVKAEVEAVAGAGACGKDGTPTTAGQRPVLIVSLSGGVDSMVSSNGGGSTKPLSPLANDVTPPSFPTNESPLLHSTPSFFTPHRQVLTHILLVLRARLGYTYDVATVHVNYGNRKEARAEADFLRRWCVDR